uniref:Uncharacterized protein n=1 Tax=Diacronema lutheri TaxID=2081491 RepID=A0A7R9UW43_DIALT
MLRGLTSLDLTYNALTGTIPTEIGALPAIVQLKLEGNQLSGRIPYCVFHCAAAAQIEVVSLFDNQLTGAIPTEVGLLTQLKQFWSFGNRMNCTLPTEVAVLSPSLFDTDDCDEVQDQ